MNRYYSNKGSVLPAVKRIIIENDLIEAYHWLPQDIKKIPYKDLQYYWLVRKQRTETISAKQQFEAQIASSKAKAVSSGRGQTKSYNYTKL